MIKLLLVICIIGMFIPFTTPLLAQDSISTEQIKARIQCIENLLNQSKKSVNTWWYGWLGVYGAATIAQGTVLLLSNDLTTQQDMALGGVTTLLGTGFQLITPLNTGKDAQYIAQLPESNTQELFDKLRIAEELFKINAEKEKTGRSWQVHALNEIVNLGSGLITWLAFKRSVWDGVSNFLLNSVVTETQIWTQPTRLMKDYQNYNHKYKSDSDFLVTKIQPEFFLRTYAGGVSVSIVF